MICYYKSNTTQYYKNNTIHYYKSDTIPTKIKKVIQYVITKAVLHNIIKNNTTQYYKNNMIHYYKSDAMPTKIKSDTIHVWFVLNLWLLSVVRILPT